MIRIENECVQCEMVGCLGVVCPYIDVKRFYCDKCGSEEKLYHYDGLELCEDCVLKELEVVAGSDNW